MQFYCRGFVRRDVETGLIAFIQGRMFLDFWMFIVFVCVCRKSYFLVSLAFRFYNQYGIIIILKLLIINLLYYIINILESLLIHYFKFCCIFATKFSFPLLFMSNLSNKSAILQLSSQLLHDNSLYPAVAHGAYYSCYQLMKHIWLYSMKKTENELDANCSQTKSGSHEFLLNEIVSFVKSTKKKESYDDSRTLRNDLPQLKRLRTDADYNDSLFDITKSTNSIALSKRIIQILKKY